MSGFRTCISNWSRVGGTFFKYSPGSVRRRDLDLFSCRENRRAGEGERVAVIVRVSFFPPPSLEMEFLKEPVEKSPRENSEDGRG